MKYRKATLLASESANTAGQKTIPLDLTEVISRLQVKFNATNNSQTPTAHHAAQISRVEIVDGSDVLAFLSARQIEALSFYETHIPRFYPLDYRNGNEQQLVLDMYFGRKLWDPELALDPKKFTNPQLKITHNKASGGSLPNAATLEVFADVFDEKVVTPMGFLMNKEIYSFTSGSSASNEYVDLPNDYAIRRIMVEARKSQTWWDNIITELQVDEESGRRSPWNQDGLDLLNLVLQSYPQYVERLITSFTGAASVLHYITPTEEANVIATGIDTGASAFCEGQEYPVGGEVYIRAPASSFARALVMGGCPHGIVPLDCGDLMDPSDWYDVTTKGKIKLRLKASGTATVNVILQQLRKYA